MKVLVTGATGLIGRELCAELKARGHALVVTSRDPKRAGPALGAEAYAWDALSGEFPLEALAGVEGIVHLAGEPIAERFWTASVRKRILESRTKGTAALGCAIEKSGLKPRVLVASSALGLYGDRGDEVLSETSSDGSGFLAEVCQAWESASRAAGVRCGRVVLIRTGLVLSNRGGFLAKMLTPFRLGIGTVFGDGSNWMSWIHVRDLVRLMATALENDRMTGPLNGVAPNPVTQTEFADTLARVLGRPRFFKVPGFALRTGLGQMSELMLSSQRVSAKKALDAGFIYEQQTLETALRASI